MKGKKGLTFCKYKLFNRESKYSSIYIIFDVQDKMTFHSFVFSSRAASNEISAQETN